MTPKTELWLKGGIAAAISGCFGGLATALTVGAGHVTPRVILASMGISSIVGVAAYLQKSPLPPNGQ